ncbi:MAG: metal ABC transporter permease [Solobacterium sp.]|nr:metal ABC transporter permease [Solobacterium sp.]MBR2829774.1 metal ABC transporter permease [Solobacterium sp.]MBR3128526.1 metal ABC transporter permease [Solobacterium sp.]
MARYLQYPFVRYALIVGVLIALCSAMLGVILVLKRFSYIGDGLSHVAFGAMTIATITGMLAQKMLIILPITILAAVLLLKGGSHTRISGDARIAMVSVGALALGYLMMNVFNTSANISADVCSTLFGSTSILTLTIQEVWLCAVLSIAVVILFILFYNRIFALTFDEDFAGASGLNTRAYNLAVAVIVAVIIVLAMNLVGSLLISALVIFPAISAMQVFRSFRSVTVCAAVFSVCGALAGMIISILQGTPVGSTIVAANIVIFLACMVISRITGRTYA